MHKQSNTIEINEFYSFGLQNQQTSSTQFGSKEQRYKYNGKELMKDFGLESEDYGARLYSPQIGRWSVIDAKAEKYQTLTPYHYAADNPIVFIDIDGNEIIPYHITNLDGAGNSISKKGELSAKTNGSIASLLKTASGLAFFSQFAKKGQTIGGYTFEKDGALSSHDLAIYDYSLEQYDGNLADFSQGSLDADFNEKKGNIQFKMSVVSLGKDKYGIAETITHESQLHGFTFIKAIIDAFKKGGKEGFKKAKAAENKANPHGTTDHNDQKNKNTKNNGYKAYLKQRDELLEDDFGFKKAFDDEGKK